MGLGLAKKDSRVYASRNATGSAPTLKGLMLIINIMLLQKHSWSSKFQADPKSDWHYCPSGSNLALCEAASMETDGNDLG